MSNQYNTEHDPLITDNELSESAEIEQSYSSGAEVDEQPADESFNEDALNEASLEANPINDNQDTDVVDSESTQLEDSDSDGDSDATDEQPEVEATPIEINILDEDYTIFCPVGEEQGLQSATNYINDFINGIREEAPSLSQKNLLVLACLNMYERMKQAQDSASSEEALLRHANRLVNQMIDDMQSE